MPRPVTVVILCWNHWPLTERCLETLFARTDLPDVTVVAVDNGSTDETPSRLKSDPRIRVVTLPANLGFARGNNAGIASADPESDVLLLNNDVEITQPDWLAALRSAAHGAPDIGVVGCRLTFPDGRLAHAGTYILPDTFWGQQVGSQERDVNQFAATRDVEGIVFACAYLRREVLDAVGGLSEEFESYFEDTDYCLRARAAGFRTVCCGKVTLVHHEHGSTRDAPDHFRKLFRRSRAVFRKRWGDALSGRYPRALHWQSILNFPTGYAMSARELLRSLDEAGVRTSYEYVYGPGTPFTVPEPDGLGDHRLDAIARRFAGRRPDVSVVYAQGDVFRKNRGRHRIGYTMLEVDGFPGEWVRQANEMDEVWVPSAFNRDGLAASGVTKPLHVMPLGVDPDHFHPEIRGVPNPNGDFVFLSNFEWNERKAPQLLLSVFNRTFRASEPVLLVCKVLNRQWERNVTAEVRALGLPSTGGRVAFLYNRDYPYSQMGTLYRSADCYVSASRGEGWDMPLLEAMACGLPAIATDWGAHREFVHDGIAWPLRIRGLVPAVSYNPNYEGFRWADPDPDHLAGLLRHVFENRDEARAKGARAAAEMAARWSWRRAAERIRARLDAIGA
jgi:hypothetical protein